MRRSRAFYRGHRQPLTATRPSPRVGSHRTPAPRTPNHSRARDRTGDLYGQRRRPTDPCLDSTLDGCVPYPMPYYSPEWIENRSKFPAPPEQLYAEKTICVMGAIQLYRGSPEIIVSSPAQIRAM